MKAAVVGVLLGAGLVLLAAGMPEIPRVQANPPASGFSSDLITLSTTLGDHRQQLTLIDPRQRSMAVYQVDSATGEVALKSVRNFHWDLQMSEFNCTAPLPREIRSQLEAR
jgi:hypothetical protein